MTTMTKTFTINNSQMMLGPNMYTTGTSTLGGEPSVKGGLVIELAYKMGLSPDRKSGLSMMNPSLMKLGNKSRSGSRGAQANDKQSRVSRGSIMTKRTGTKDGS